MLLTDGAWHLKAYHKKDNGSAGLVAYVNKKYLLQKIILKMFFILSRKHYD